MSGCAQASIMFKDPDYRDQAVKTAGDTARDLLSQPWKSFQRTGLNGFETLASGHVVGGFSTIFNLRSKIMCVCDSVAESHNGIPTKLACDKPLQRRKG